MTVASALPVLPSLTEVLTSEATGAASSSRIVSSPAPSLRVALVGVPRVNVTVSSSSSSASLVTGTVNVAEVDPAGIETDPLPAVKSEPDAVPALVDHGTVTVRPEVPPSETVTWTLVGVAPPVPSATEVSSTETVGSPSSSLIVTAALPSALVALVTEPSVTVAVSSSSSRASATTESGMVVEVEPAGIVAVPVPSVRSAPVAVPPEIVHGMLT